MKRKKPTIGIQKLEVDEKTSKLKIVKTKADYNLPEITLEEEPLPDEKINQSSVGKQIVMERILGFKQYDKNIAKYVHTYTFLINKMLQRLF